MLETINWVDFRVTDLDPLDRLVWGLPEKTTGPVPRFICNQSNGTSGSCCQETASASAKGGN